MRSVTFLPRAHQASRGNAPTHLQAASKSNPNQDTNPPRFFFGLFFSFTEERLAQFGSGRLAAGTQQTASTSGTAVFPRNRRSVVSRCAQQNPAIGLSVQQHEIPRDPFFTRFFPCVEDAAH